MILDKRKHYFVPCCWAKQLCVLSKCPRRQWEASSYVKDIIEMDIKKIGKVSMNWIYTNQDACRCWLWLTEELLAPQESSYISSKWFCFMHWDSSLVFFLISNLRLVLNVVWFLLGNSPAPEFYMLTFRNTLSVPSVICRRNVGI